MGWWEALCWLEAWGLGPWSPKSGGAHEHEECESTLKHSIEWHIWIKSLLAGSFRRERYTLSPAYTVPVKRSLYALNQPVTDSRLACVT